MHKLPLDLNLDDIDILKALSNANNKIGELNGLVKALPNPFDIALHQDRAVAATSMEVEKISNKYLDENKKSLPRTCKMKYLTKEQAIYIQNSPFLGKKIF